MCAPRSACRPIPIAPPTTSSRGPARTVSRRAYELARAPGEAPPTALQTLYVADELDVRLARIAADAALAEQEIGLSTLFMAFGFVRWYESAESEAARLAPLLLLPVTLSRRMEESRAVYAVRAAAEFPLLNPSLREWFVQAGAPALPEFDLETDNIESFFERRPKPSRVSIAGRSSAT